MRRLIGLGVAKGLLATLREFLGTYGPGRLLLKALGQEGTNGLTTQEYPERPQQHAERFRYFPFLVYDGSPDNLRCVACKICEQECPPQCIHIVMQKDEQGRVAKAHGRTFPAEFDIDTSICMSCRICVDVCPFDAIEMDNRYEYAGQDRFGRMVFDRDALLRSNEYFRTIKPTEAAGVDRRLEAKQKKAAPAQGSAGSGDGS
ncbi:MAG TPA: 4Fe-4S dicluster domain-containing protein [bacterium]